MSTTQYKDRYYDNCGYQFASNCIKKNNNIRQYQHAAEVFNAEHGCKAIIIKENMRYSYLDNLLITDASQFSVWLAPNCPNTKSFWKNAHGGH